MKTTVVGYPRIGRLRELKFAIEKYFRKEITQEELLVTAQGLRQTNWKTLQAAGIDAIPSGDFSFYDITLDTAALLNIIPQRYQALDVSDLDRYFAMARGYQGDAGDVKALAMKKWFNTNYHYMVPEFEDELEIRLVGTKLFDEYLEAKALGIETRPTLVGPFTLLKLLKFKGNKGPKDVAADLVAAYQKIFQKLNELGAEWVQVDEPALVLDLEQEEITFFQALYQELLQAKGDLNVLVQTYFGDVRDVYQELVALPVAAIGLDFVEGRKNYELLNQHGFPQDKQLFAGVVNGKNIWRNHYSATIDLVKELEAAAQVVLTTSCSLLHVPYTLENETKLTADQKRHFAFAEEKLTELTELSRILTVGDEAAYQQNQALFQQERIPKNQAVAAKIAQLTEADFVRQPDLAERAALQKETFRLPLLPTTTIGSFPQTKEVKQNRAKFKKGEVTEAAYTAFNHQQIADCVKLQEELGLDVLVHGEFERNDMVEYFGESLDGYLFSEKAWVQSYGTRCVKPPIIWGDVVRSRPITVDYSVYAQSLTQLPMKGMLTGPVTILNWSFPREDISLKESTYQLALAIQEEVLDLEKNGIRIIQIDEAALREKLPLRKTDWHSQYLSWAIPAFRLVHSKVQPETQIHTHMCYSEFEDIIDDIEAMDPDVISFEASRSDLSLLDVLNRVDFQPQVGPGVYDIHSPRVPTVDEITNTLNKILAKIPAERVWVNPDCGLKTRGVPETVASLENMVQAALAVREGIQYEIKSTI